MSDADDECTCGLHLAARFLQPRGTLNCGWCEEPLDPGEAFHPECIVRGLVGPVDHLEKRCDCYVEDGPECTPGDLSRDSARASFAWMMARQAAEP